MLSPFPVTPSQTSITFPYPFASMRGLLLPLSHSCLTALTFPYTGASGLHRTKALPSQ